MNILQVKKYCLLKILSSKFAYSPIGKAFEKTNRKSDWCYKISRPF